MTFKRVWDSSCPREWDSWEVDGVRWVIRDLPPGDDELALKLLVEHLCPEATLSVLSGMTKDPVSMKSAIDSWRGTLAHRMSLGCYEEKDGHRKLVALNVCHVSCQGDEPNYVVEGKAWKNVSDAKKYCFKRVDPFKLLGVDKVLSSCGLVVHKDYRGAKLAYRILVARELLALHHGIFGTSAVFSSPASQVTAERAGFFTALTVTLKELADAGLDFPKDERRSVKVMMRKYGCAVISKQFLIK